MDPYENRQQEQVQQEVLDAKTLWFKYMIDGLHELGQHGQYRHTHWHITQTHVIITRGANSPHL